MRVITRKSKEAAYRTISDSIMIFLKSNSATVDGVLKAGPYNKKQIQRGMYNLRNHGFIAFPARSSRARVILTKLGIRRLDKQKFEDLTIQPAAWDRKWRLLTFDIPENQNAIRHVFRRKLKQLGFFHFQRSVFILPYPCVDEVNQMTDYLEITPNVHILTADRFPGDGALVKKFQL